tara:strand:+ start:113 stop:1150 length:1038 start_codon:yes stop_codon:yes gene_type:complete
VLYGNNGTGKTNILESISLFDRGKGFRKDNLNNLINFKSNIKNFKVESIFQKKNNEVHLKIFNQINKKNSIKKILVNESSSKESINYLDDLFSLIYFLPEMERLFIKSPSIRRNFIDNLISSIDKNYNSILINYKKSIFERNKILKNTSYDPDWITNIEKNIVNSGIQIYEKRLNQISLINSNLMKLENLEKSFYKINFSLYDEFLLNKDINPNLLYDEYLNKLKHNRNIDTIIGGSKIGPHKSDIVGYKIEDNFNINQLSTGQQKTVVLLIIIAQSKFIINDLNKNPIIIFDEVCSHLDTNNRTLLLDLIELLKVQIFMSGTEKKFFSFLSTNTNYCNINNKYE